MEYYGKILCISYHDLTCGENPIMSVPNYKKLSSTGKINVVRQGKGLGNYALVEVATLPKRFQEKIKEKYGDDRLTKIVPAAGEFNAEDLVKEEQTVVALTHFGYIKRMPIDIYRSQRRGGKGITGIATREEDFVKQIFTSISSSPNI